MRKSIKFLSFILLTALLLSACGSSEDLSASAAEPAGSTLGFTERGDSISGEYTDGSGNLYTYTYSLPVVSGDTDYVAAVNAELDGVFETYIAPELPHMDAGNSLVTTYASWRAAEYKGITSLIVCLHNSWDDSIYYVYHFTADGKQAMNADVFAALGISGEEFSAAAFETLSDYLRVDGAEGKTEEVRAALEACREQTLSPENCNAELPIFVTSYGTLCFVGRVYTPAGAGYYDHLFILTPQSGFTAEELAELAREYYGMNYGHRPEFAAAESNEDGTVTVQLYDLVGDHNSTCAWYIVSPADGTGVDPLDNRIDLTVQ